MFSIIIYERKTLEDNRTRQTTIEYKCNFICSAVWKFGSAQGLMDKFVAPKN